MYPRAQTLIVKQVKPKFDYLQTPFDTIWKLRPLSCSSAAIRFYFLRLLHANIYSDRWRPTEPSSTKVHSVETISTSWTWWWSACPSSPPEYSEYDVTFFCFFFPDRGHVSTDAPINLPQLPMFIPTLCADLHLIFATLPSKHLHRRSQYHQTYICIITW